MATPNRNYTEIPGSAVPDVPYRVNVSLREIDADVSGLAASVAAASASATNATTAAVTARSIADMNTGIAVESRATANNAAAEVSRLEGALALIDGENLAATVADAQEAADAASAAAAAAVAPAAAVVENILSDPASAPSVRLENAYGTAVSVMKYAPFYGGTEHTAAINDALTALANGGELVFPGGRTYTTAGGHLVPVGVTISGLGASIVHTGNNTLFNFNRSGGFNLTRPTGIYGLKITGNAGVTAVAIEAGNSWGFTARRLSITGYSAGIGMLFDNKYNWGEGYVLDGVILSANKTAVRYRVTTGTASFAYTRMKDVSINVPADAVGIDIGGESPSNVYFYNAEVTAAIWLGGNNAIGIRIGLKTSIDNTRFGVTGEVFGALTGHKGFQNLGGYVKGWGHINVKSAPDDLTLGTTRILTGQRTLDSTVTADGKSFRSTLMANIDNAHDATFGFLAYPNNSIPYVSGYSGGSASFKVKKCGIGQTAATGTDLFTVNNDGSITFGAEHTGMIRARPGNPDANWLGYGALHIRTDDVGYGTSLYVKNSNAGVNGWAQIEQRRSGSTANRPPVGAGSDRGLMYWDTTLEKPIWWNGFWWVDANKVQV